MVNRMAASPILMQRSMKHHKRTNYLFGHIAPEWGGPQTSNLKLALEKTSTGCIMKVTDARHGHIDDMTSYADGWRQIFTDGLKKYVES